MVVYIPGMYSGGWERPSLAAFGRRPRCLPQRPHWGRRNRPEDQRMTASAPRSHPTAVLPKRRCGASSFSEAAALSVLSAALAGVAGSSDLEALLRRVAEVRTMAEKQRNTNGAGPPLPWGKPHGEEDRDPASGRPPPPPAPPQLRGAD
jgi:hypothetical protein